MIKYFLYLFRDSYKIWNVRNFLTGVGIVVGISALICINVISSSFSSHVEKSLISNQYIIGIESSSFSDLDYESILKDENIQHKINEIKYISGVKSFEKDYIKKVVYVSKQGESKSFKMSYEFNDNLEFIEKSDNLKSYNQVYIKCNPEFKEIFQINDKIIINSEFYKITGLYEDSNNEADIIFPSYLKDKIVNNDIEETGNYVLTIDSNKESHELIVNKVIRYLNNDLDEGFRFANFSDQFSSGLKDSIDSITIFISLISGVSLLVACLNVVNSMYMNVLEREKEIVLLRVLGMNKKNILSLFICETIFIVLIYAFIGVVVGMILGFIFTLFINVSFSIDFIKLVIIVFITFILGVIAGINPAIKASNINVSSILK